MRTMLAVEEKNLLISEEDWNDLKAGSNTVAYQNVKDLVTDFVARDGNFIIHRDLEGDTSVIRSFHRKSDLTQYLDEVDQKRAELGL